MTKSTLNFGLFLNFLYLGNFYYFWAKYRKSNKSGCTINSDLLGIKSQRHAPTIEENKIS